MAIVSDLPFTLRLIKNFPSISVQEAMLFSDNEKEIWKDGFITLSVEENDEIEIYFNSQDRNAKLYLEALDIIPLADDNIYEDESGRLYRTISDTQFALYKSNAGYDALRVDTFKISVYCDAEWYYGTFQILPKPMSMSEWQMMRNDLEKEIRGLAQDIVRRNIGIGEFKRGNIPPKVIYDFFVIKKYSCKVMMALMDIADNPRSEIVTQYKQVVNNKSDIYQFDAETVKRFATKSGSEPIFKVPVKTMSYDIQDNRLLKMILIEYEDKLKQFVALIDEVEKFSNIPNSGGTAQYELAWNKSLSEFKIIAIKLMKMTAIIKSQDWYAKVGIYKEPYVPHSFILDCRYSLFYQMYLDLKKDKINIELNPEFSYTWKRSSYMYEMWCFLKICRIFMSEYEFESTEWDKIFADKVIFPFLASGTKMKFEKNNIHLEVVYDKCLPLKGDDTSIDNPLFMAKNSASNKSHNRPDILLNVYEKTRGWYLGTIIVECKYRKLNSFWQENSERSSRGQLQTYYNNARSSVLLGGYGDVLSMRPVTKIIVLTPDDLGEGKEQQDFEILVKGFKAANDDDRVDSLKNLLHAEIDALENRFVKLQELKS